MFAAAVHGETFYLKDETVPGIADFKSIRIMVGLFKLMALPMHFGDILC